MEKLKLDVLEIKEDLELIKKELKRFAELLLELALKEETLENSLTVLSEYVEAESNRVDAIEQDLYASESTDLLTPKDPKITN